MKFKTFTSAIFIVMIFIAVGCSAQSTTTEITLLWTASHDDGLTLAEIDSLGLVVDSGTCVSYDFRYSTDSITLVNWETADTLIGEPDPGIPFSDETFTFTLELEVNTTYYIAVKVSDEENYSDISNFAYISIGNWIPPAIIIDLRVKQGF